jgi:hypothetical protein
MNDNSERAVARPLSIFTVRKAGTAALSGLLGACDPTAADLSFELKKLEAVG